MGKKKRMRDIFDNLAPIDYRYWDKEVAHYLSENGFTRYKLRVELALIRVLNRRGICSDTVVKEVEKACQLVTTAEVYDEEDRIKHDIRALVNCLRAKVSASSRPYVHMTATSYDIIDPANAARYRDAVNEVLLPYLTRLLSLLVRITLKEADQLQIGRTHGQHAVPITFGFATAKYVSRIGGSIVALTALSQELPGKFSGAVGAYNASSLFFDDPKGFAKEILAELDLKPSEHSTQIVPPEAMTRLLCEISIVAGILANLADDLRHLQRTEIGEVGEAFTVGQVGSSTMPQKRNPVVKENTKSAWKIVAPRIITVFMDQISEHERDLTGSMSARTYGEVVAYVIHMAKSSISILTKLIVDEGNLDRNLKMQGDLILAEPLYLLLAYLGHPDAHEKVRMLTLEAQRQGASLAKVSGNDPEIGGYLLRMTPKQREILDNPSLYTGIAAEEARAVATRWKTQLNLPD